MSKLLFVFERDMPTVSITRDIFMHLRYFPSIKSDFIYLTDVRREDIDSHDIIIFMRPDNGYSWRIAKKAKQAGHVTVTFCDDDLLNLPPTEPTIPWRKRGLIKTLAYSDVIWSSSRYILDKYCRLTAGKRTAITDTIIQREEIKESASRSKNDVVKIVYAAAPSHAELFEKYIGPIIPKLVNEFGDKISFTFISVHPKVEGVKCEYISGMSLLEYRKYMKEQHFDIGVAPLPDNEFSKCKYFNKFLEYTTQGVVGVYSKTEPYTYVVQNEINGMLVEGNPKSWYHALSTVIRDKDLRENCVNNAIQYIMENHLEKACIEKIRQGIPEILETNGGYSRCRSFGVFRYKYFMTRPFDWLYLTGFYLSNTGIRAVIKRVKTHIVESKAYSRRSI